MNKKILLSSIAVFMLSACGPGDNDPQHYTGLDLTGAQSLVLKRVNETATGIVAAQSESGDIDTETVLYKVTENGLEEVTFLDENDVPTTITYQPACVKNINDNFFATYSRQHLPLMFTLTDENGTIVKTDQKSTNAILIVRKSDGKIFPFQDNFGQDVYITRNGRYQSNTSTCIDIITSADLWTLPRNTVLLKSVTDGASEDTQDKGQFELLVELSDSGSLASNKFTLPEERSTNVIISSNAYGYEASNGFRIIGDSYQASGRLVDRDSSEYRVLLDGESNYFKLPDNANYRHRREAVYNSEAQEYTYESVLTKITLTSDAQLMEQEVFRGSYSALDPYNWQPSYRYPNSDIFLAGCDWFEYNASLPQKLAFRSSTIPDELIASYDPEDFHCRLIESEVNIVSYPNYASEGYLSFFIFVDVNGNGYFEDNDDKYLAQYNPITKDRLIQQYPAHGLASYGANTGDFLSIGKGLLEFDSSAYNSNGDLINLYFDLVTGEITEKVEQENSRGYIWVAPLN